MPVQNSYDLTGGQHIREQPTRVMGDAETREDRASAMLGVVCAERSRTVDRDLPAVHAETRVSEFENYTRDLFDVEIVRRLLRGHAKDNPEAMRASATRAYDALGWIQQALSIAPYLARDDITAADIVALPNIQMLRRVAARPEVIEMALGLEDLGARLPALSAWLSRIETMRGYDAAYPPHWRS